MVSHCETFMVHFALLVLYGGNPSVIPFTKGQKCKVLIWFFYCWPGQPVEQIVNDLRRRDVHVSLTNANTTKPLLGMQCQYSFEPNPVCPMKTMHVSYFKYVHGISCALLSRGFRWFNYPYLPSLTWGKLLRHSNFRCHFVLDCFI